MYSALPSISLYTDAPLQGFKESVTKLSDYDFTVFCVLSPGIDGVLAAYTNCIQYIQLYGPTNVSPIINHVARFASSAQQEEAQKGPHVSCAALRYLIIYNFVYHDQARGTKHQYK